MSSRLACIVISIITLACLSDVRAAATSAQDIVAALSVQPVDARDLKTLHYVENAHGQLEEWSLRLLARLEADKGPRMNDPIFDGRADLQVRKILVTYAGYTRNPRLADALQALANAHIERLQAVQAMVGAGVDRARYEELDATVQSLIIGLREWRKYK